MPNINSILGLSLVTVNVAQSQTTANVSLQGITLPSTAVYYDQFFQVATPGPTTVPLPGATVWALYVRNLGANVVTYNYTMTGGGTGTGQLGPVTSGFGGILLFFQTVETANGITGLTLSAALAITPVEILAAY